MLTKPPSPTSNTLSFFVVVNFGGDFIDSIPNVYVALAQDGSQTIAVIRLYVYHIQGNFHNFM